jgi:microcystin degradation protein MlrC
VPDAPRPLRIAFARLAQETHALSPVRTTLEDFRQCHLREGADLLAACESDGDEVPGFLKQAELSGFVRAVRQWDGPVELVPLFSAWTIPSGPMDPEAFLHFRTRLIEGLREAGELDGVFLSVHGALSVPGVVDPEAELFRAVRDVCGPIPLAVTFDLHGNLTRRKFEGADILCAYRTNPHRDHARTGQRAGELLLRTLDGQIRPTRAWRALPMVLGGGRTVDFLPPMRPLYRWMRKAERDPRVLYVSLFQCQLWLDHEEVGWASCILTDDDPELAEQLADELAELAWEVRHQQPPEFPGALEAIARAREARWARRLGTVCMCDASDVVGAGGTGDNTRLLRAFLEHGTDLRTLFGLRDPVAVDALWEEPEGRRVQLAIGGRIDPDRNAPLPVVGRVGRRIRAEGFGRMRVLHVDNVDVVLTEGPSLVVKPSFYTRLGLKVWKADVVVVKTLFPFRLFFAHVNRQTIYARTEGITDFDAAIREIAWDAPLHPRDEVADWRPNDRRRRGVVEVA